MKYNSVIAARFDPDMQVYVSLMGEFDRVVQQVYEHLSEAFGVASHDLVDIGVDIEEQFQILAAGLHRQGLDYR